MKRWVTVMALVLAAASTGRQVEVRTGPETSTPQGAVSLRVNNSLSQAVNVYVVSGSVETFVAQVAAQSTQTVAVAGVTPGATVTLRARQVDGRQSYERANVTLTSGMMDWRVP
jgi:phosphotransferase system HPr-like phosphotransfer protein